MGAKRKVDAKLYNKLSKELRTPKDDKKVMEKYGLGQTTVRAIRNSLDYEHFINKTSRKKISSQEITLNSSRQPASPTDKAVAVFSWIALFGIVFAIGLCFRWLCWVIFGC